MDWLALGDDLGGGFRAVLLVATLLNFGELPYGFLGELPVLMSPGICDGERHIAPLPTLFAFLLFTSLLFTRSPVRAPVFLLLVW